MRRHLLVASLVSLAVPASAQAVIVPQKSIMGIELGMTKAEVKAEAGQPDAVRHPRNEIIGRYTEYQYGLTQIGIATNSGVIYVSTRDRDERTASGLGVGSSKRAVKRKLQGETCQKLPRGSRCFLGQELPGRTVTDFRFRRGKVRSVLLGRVID